MSYEKNPFVTPPNKQVRHHSACSYPDEVLAAMLFVAAEGSALTALAKAWGKRVFTDPQRQLIMMSVTLFIGLAVGLFYAYSKRQAAVERRLELSKSMTHQEEKAMGGNLIEMMPLSQKRH